MPPSAYPLAFPGAFASEAILPASRPATDRLLRADALRALTGLSRSWFPFDAERRIPLSAGMSARVLSDNEGSRPTLHPFPFWAGYKISGKPGKNDDDSGVGSFAYPCSALLGGVLDRVSSYRLSSPLHTGGCQAARMGEVLSPQHQRGGNRTHTETKLSSLSRPTRQVVRLLSYCTQHLAMQHVTSERVALLRSSWVSS